MSEKLSTEERVELINEVGEEVIGNDELPKLLESDHELICYDGFEPSGQMHIAQGVLRAINVNKMIKAGFKFKMLVADWHGYLNNKMGGDIEKIQTVGKYFVEIWRACGMDLDNVEFVWASDLVKQDGYWELVMKIAQSTSLKRILRTTQIMGRGEQDSLNSSQILYPCMQTADIFMLGANVTQLGMDQRKVNMLAREVGKDLGYWKPIIVSNHMLMGLQKATASANDTIFSINIKDTPKDSKSEGDFTISWKKEEDTSVEFIVTKKDDKQPQHIWFGHSTTMAEAPPVQKKHGVTIKTLDNDFTEFEITVPKKSLDRQIEMKMSKSKPDTAIFMTDTKEDIARKIKKAWAPEKEIKDNPILEYCKYIIFEKYGTLDIKRPEKFGGDISYKNYEDLEKSYESGELFPLDLKNTLVEYLDELVAPVRKHFEEDKKAKALLEKVRSYQITR